MQSTLSSSPSPGLHAGGEFLAGDLSAVHELACRLKAASLAGRTGERPLAGKNIALLRQRPADAEMSALHRAALDLGARVAHVRLGPRSIRAAPSSATFRRCWAGCTTPSIAPP